MSSFETFALLSSTKIDNKYDELQSLIDLDRFTSQLINSNGENPLHVACKNPHVTLRVVKLLLNAWPESISQPNRHGNLPIHYFCRNVKLDETVSVDILNYLLETSPESIQGEDSVGGLPIHTAARYGKSLGFLNILVDSHPESVRIIRGEIRALPIHLACSSDNCRLDTVEYLLEKYPGSINVEAYAGWLPIHHAAYSKGSQSAVIIEHLMLKDPDCASKVTEDGSTPLFLACYSHPNLTAIQLLFDVYPEAILIRNSERKTPLECAREYIENDEDGVAQRDAVITFVEAQLVYAEQAQDMNTMTTLDHNGRLPLHHALKDNAPLGSIKLLVKGNTSAIRVPNNNMAFPLHVACEFSSGKVVKYLMNMLDDRMKNHLDANDDSILHYACRGGNCEVVKYLLHKQSPHVSKRNADGKLPIQLFCEAGSSSDSLEHTDTVYRLLLAYPETVREYM